mmetsp:Transcript_39384/g.122803  ORF Transcript_39384/g.122803 Transcript_39384/m.122803 type:complete len:653 (+) Transcript_39384:119-2077(+)
MGETSDSSYSFAFGVVGTRGDFQPYLSLAINLKKRGHRVKFYTSTTHCKTATEFGIDCLATGGDTEQGLQDETALRAMEKGDFALILAPREEAEEKEPELVDGMNPDELRERATQDFEELHPDCYLTNLLGHVPGFDKLIDTNEILKVDIALQPQAGPPSNAFMHLMWARGFPEPDTPRICSHIWSIQQTARQLHQYNQFCVMQTPPDHHEQLIAHLSGPESSFHYGIKQDIRASPTILAFSSNVFPPPDDWPDVMHDGSRVRIVGNMKFTKEQQDELASAGYSFFTTGKGHEACKQFIAAGDPPVYIGWGSMTVYGSQHMTRLAVGALKQAEQRGIIVSGWAGLCYEDLTKEEKDEELRAFAEKNVLFVKSAPHEWLFPQCSCCVHHGGIGTMQASLNAGTPTIITPVFADQESNAEALTAGGWGTSTTKLGKLKAKELGQKIREVCTEPKYKEATQALHKRMQKEDGIKLTTELLEHYIRDELRTGKYKEMREAEAAELLAIRKKQIGLPAETIFAKWNADLNKRYPAWREFNMSQMKFTGSCKDLLDAGRLWVVSASSVLAREGEGLTTPEAGRFKKYCYLEQLEKKGQRLRVKKVRGWGPAEGWVSTKASGAEMLELIKDMSRITELNIEVYNKAFADLMEMPGMKKT